MKKLEAIITTFIVLAVLGLIVILSPLRSIALNLLDPATEYPIHETIPTVRSVVPDQQGTWTIDTAGWTYSDNNHQVPKGETRTIGGVEYFFDDKGYMQTGWVQTSNTWYYLSYAGHRETGWIDDEGKRYYLNEDGSMTTGWKTIEGKEYHFEDNGSLSTGWILLDDKYYYIEEDGTPHTGWLIEGDKYYYLEADGVMKVGWVQEDENTWYYMGEDGSMVTGWQTIDNKNYYFSDMGSMYVGWLSDAGKWYYFNDNGSMATGWLKLDSKNYYLDPTTGAMRKGWIVDQKKAYYLNSDGVLETNPKATKQGAVIALTFDDGPGQYTDRVLNALEKSNAKATFFVLGELVDAYPDALKRMQSLGCQIANHSYSHANLTRLDKAGVKAEIKNTRAKIKAIIGKNPSSLLRPPGGNYNDEVKEYTNAPLILWSMDTRDWESKNTTAVAEMILNQAQDGDIILLHDIHSTTVDAAEIVIPALTSMGYKLETVSGLAKAKGVKIEKKQVYNSF